MGIYKSSNLTYEELKFFYLYYTILYSSSNLTYEELKYHRDYRPLIGEGGSNLTYEELKCRSVCRTVGQEGVLILPMRN